MRTRLLTVILIAVAQCTWAQTKTKTVSAEILTNKSIVALHEVGLQNDVIISKIQSSPTKFSLSTDDLIALKKSGIENVVIKAMMDKTTGITAPVEKSVAKPPVNKVALEMLNHPYLYDRNTKSYKPLDKSISGIKTKSKMLGYGGTSFQYEIEGEKANARIAATDSLVFLINTAGSAMPELTLYKANISKGKRIGVSAEYKVFGGMKTGQNSLTFNITSTGQQGVYKIVLSQKLVAGEYFFGGKPVNTTSIDVFAFGID